MAAPFTHFIDFTGTGHGTVIYNSLQSPELSIVQLSDPSRVTDILARQIDAWTSNVAQQINATRSAVDPPMRVVDLEQYISDIIVETTVQGSSLLELHIIDPYWTLLWRDPKTGRSFIDVDDSGYLWPPIEINFPPSVSDATWRLCQCKPTTNLSGPNLTLTFEDKIAAELREHSAVGTLAQPATDPSCAQSAQNETRAQFIKRLVVTASANPQVKGDVGIRFIPLLDPTDFTPADLTSAQTSLPASALQPNAPQGRRVPNKNATVTNADRAIAKTVQTGIQGIVTKIIMGMGVVGGNQLSSTNYPDAPPVIGGPAAPPASPVPGTRGVPGGRA